MLPEIPWQALTDDDLQALLQAIIDERRRRLAPTRPKDFVQDIREALGRGRTPDGETA